MACGLLTVRLGQHSVASQWLDGSLQEVAVASVLLPPGRTVVVLESPAAPTGGDVRPLAFALHDFELHTLASGK